MSHYIIGKDGNAVKLNDDGEIVELLPYKPLAVSVCGEAIEFQIQFDRLEMEAFVEERKRKNLRAEKRLRKLLEGENTSDK
jgi:hypothetical protein